MANQPYGTSEITTPKLVDQHWQVGYLDINGKQFITKEIYSDKKEALKKAISESRIFFTFKYFLVKVERKITTNIVKD
jgi:hypothetical protein